MRPAGFPSIAITSLPGEMPLKSIQGAPVRSGRLHLTVISLIAAAVLIPQFWVASHAITHADFRAQLVAKPIQSAQIVVAFGFWIAMFAWPIRKFSQRLRWRRHVEIDSKHVTVRDETASGAKLWREPLSAYLGVAHHVRSSLSGVRQELILVHRDRARSVLLAVDEHISEAQMSSILQMLQLPRVPSAAAYGFMSSARNPQTKDAVARPLAMAA